MAVASAQDAILQKWKDAAPPFYILIFLNLFFYVFRGGDLRDIKRRFCSYSKSKPTTGLHEEQH